MVILKAKPLLYSLTLIASIVGCLLASVSFFIGNKEYFVLLYFYIPLLWFLWIYCTFLMTSRHDLFYLFLLWCCINSIFPIILASLTVGVENIYNSKGSDMVVLVSYFPLLIPGSFFLSRLDVGFGNLGINDILSMWIEILIMILPQTFIIIVFSRILDLNQRE